MDPFGDLANLFKANEGLHKISDSDLLSMSTIEIMYTTGKGADDVDEPKHYRFLRRVLQEDYTIARRDIATYDTFGTLIRNHNNQMPIAKDTKRNKRKTPESVATSATKKKKTPKGTKRNKRKPPESVTTSPTKKKETPKATTRKGKTHPTVAINKEAAETATTAESTTEGECVTTTDTTEGECVATTDTTEESTTEGTTASTVQDGLLKYEKYFNNLFAQGTLTHRAPTKLYFKSSTAEFFVKANIKENEVRIPCADINIYDSRLVEAARELPDQWLGPSLGDSGMGDAPEYLCTKVTTIYQQHANPYCLSHSLASALFYCDSQKFRIASEGLVQLGRMITGLHFDAQIQKVRDYMQEHVPLLGRPTLYGRRPNTHLCKLRRMTWDELLLNVTPFPTVVIPKLPTGEATHAFCVVDDL
jgi:hypothetical protein